jgi:hypothetical protein
MYTAGSFFGTKKKESRKGSSALWKEEGGSFLYNVNQWRIG